MKTVKSNTPLGELSAAELDRLIRYHEARGRMLRSDAMKRGMGGFFTSINRGFKSIVQLFSGAPAIATPRSGAA